MSKICDFFKKLFGIKKKEVKVVSTPKVTSAPKRKSKSTVSTGSEPYTTKKKGPTKKKPAAKKPATKKSSGGGTSKGTKPYNTK